VLPRLAAATKHQPQVGSQDMFREDRCWFQVLSMSLQLTNVLPMCCHRCACLCVQEQALFVGVLEHLLCGPVAMREGDVATTLKLAMQGGGLLPSNTGAFLNLRVYRGLSQLLNIL
jgi:hypothetical protein